MVDGPVPGQEEEVVGKALLDPLVQVLRLLGHRGAALPEEELDELRAPLVEPGEAAEVGVGGLQGVNPRLLPLVGLPADLGEGGLPAGALGLGLLHLGLDGVDVPAGEGEQHLRRQGEKVVEGVEDFQVRGGEDLPQQLLHRRDQVPEALPVLEGLGDVLGGVLRRAVVLQLLGDGGEDRSVRGEQAQLDEGVLGPLHLFRAPGEGPAVPPGGQDQVEQGGVPVALPGQLIHRGPVEGEDISRKEQVLGHRHLQIGMGERDRVFPYFTGNSPATQAGPGAGRGGLARTGS